MSIIPQAGLITKVWIISYGPLYAPGEFVPVPPPVDLDIGGIERQWDKIFLGPGLGWIRAPVDSVLPITAAGTYFADPSYSIITVNVAGAVTIVLPSAKASAAGPQAVPGAFIKGPLTITDIGGNAQAHPILITAAGSEGIGGFATISITTNYGSYTIQPVSPPSVSVGNWMITSQVP